MSDKDPLSESNFFHFTFGISTFKIMIQLFVIARITSAVLCHTISIVLVTVLERPLDLIIVMPKGLIWLKLGHVCIFLTKNFY